MQQSDKSSTASNCRIKVVMPFATARRESHLPCALSMLLAALVMLMPFCIQDTYFRVPWRSQRGAHDQTQSQLVTATVMSTQDKRLAGHTEELPGSREGSQGDKHDCVNAQVAPLQRHGADSPDLILPACCNVADPWQRLVPALLHHLEISHLHINTANLASCTRLLAHTLPVFQ